MTDVRGVELCVGEGSWAESGKNTCLSYNRPQSYPTYPIEHSVIEPNRTPIVRLGSVIEHNRTHNNR